ncbi:hypothetical protein M1432_00495 [Patescibacteria group bacterium]|nr:hypothetical protein [Patescibacteria group bacterium]
MKDNNAVYIFLIVLTLAVIAGFYVVFRQLSVIQQVVLNVPGGGTAASSSAPIGGPSAATSTGTSTAPADSGSAAGSISIPTGIIFSTLSSPALQPQSTVTVTVTSVSLAPDGTLTVGLKAYTNQATSYSSLNPVDILQVVDLQNGNQSPVSTTGNWGSMPPGGVVTGTAVFKINPSATSTILQVGPLSSANYYEFDFSTQSYKQTVLG